MPSMDEQRRRLAWACRRGTKELDVLLDRYLRTRYADAAPACQAAFARLLELQDPLLQAYLLGQAEPQDADSRDVIRHITRDHP